MTEHQEPLAGRIRRSVIEQSRRANVGHVGCSLAIADILAALLGGVMRTTEGTADRLILSKGHAALALYAALEATGRIDRAALESFCTDGTAYGVHPEHLAPGIEFTTGSLGHGLSIGVGSALGARRRGRGGRVFVLMSDAECNEGSVWEAAMLAAHHRIDNLYVVVDVDGQQALGYTRDVLDLEPLGDRWAAFGWDAREVDGHDNTAIAEVISGCESERGRPHVLIARTTFGKGISYMEGQIKWHYWPMSDPEYEQALEELGASG